MAAHFLKELDLRGIAELKAFARHPARTINDVCQWLDAHGACGSPSAVQRWLTEFREREAIEVTEAIAAEAARDQDTAASSAASIAAKTRAVENLTDFARVIGEARMLRDEDVYSPEAHKEIVARFRALLQRLEKSETWAARSMGIAASTLSQVLSETYAGDTEAQIRRVDKWIEQQASKLKTARPDGFLKLSTALAIIGAAKVAMDTNMIAVVYGPGGVGKSLAAKYLASESAGAIYLAITEGTKRPTGLREELYRALMLPKVKLTVPQMERAIVEKLRDSDRLIIVDEVHALVSGRSKEEDTLYMLRRIQDETRCPMIWFGTADLNTYLENGIGIRQGVDQIFRRVIQFLDLATPVLLNEPGPGCHTIEDVKKLTAARGIRVTSDGIEFLHGLSNTPGLGSIGQVDALLTYVLRRQRDKGKELTAELLRDGLHEKFGRAAATRMEKRIEEYRRKVG